jgi:hypothetical protein
LITQNHNKIGKIISSYILSSWFSNHQQPCIQYHTCLLYS